MKTLLRGLILAFVVVQISIAQKSPIKFGVIPPEDLKMTVYPKDTSAAAVILTDYGHAEMQSYASSLKLEFVRHVRIKILNKEGFHWADAAIELYHQGSAEERVARFKASTFNVENGKLVETEVSKESMFKEKFNRNINLQKFTFPNVKEGSILEYSYTVSSEFLTNFPNWKFQYPIPVRHSEYWAVIPEFCTFQKYMQGYLTGQYDLKSTNGSDFISKAHHWTMKDVPAFKVEPFMTNEDDYVSKINFAISHLNFPGQATIEIMGSWEKLRSILLEDEDFGKAITGNGFLKKEVEARIAGVTDPKAKANAIYDYVKNNFEWNGTTDFLADNLKKIVEARKGTSGDINILLASMLEKANIPIDMVLVSTRDHGFVRQEYPMSRQFNYVIVRAKLGDNFVLLDATEKYLPMDILPERCLNGEGLLISRINKGWVNLETKGKAKTVVDTEFAVDQSGGLKGKILFNRLGYDANDSRKEYFKQGEETFFKNFGSTKIWEINSSVYQNAKEIDKPAVQLHEVQIPSHASVAGNQIYLSPFLTEELTENPFRSAERVYPINYGKPIERTYIGKFSIPEGYELDELPQSKILMLPGNAAKFLYSASITGNMVSVVRTLSINKSLFLQEEYPNLREFYNQVVAKESEQIVLKKKL